MIDSAIFTTRTKQRVLLTLGVLLLAPLSGAQGAPSEGRPAVIVNEAADAIICYLYRKLPQPPGRGATRDAVLAALDKMVDQYQGTGVSHLFWNVNYQRVAYRSAAWPSYWDVADPERNCTDWPRGYYELHKLGIDDVFARLVPRCRRRGLSPWISLRMNDHHYTGDPTRVSSLFFDHPEMRTRGGKGLFNYARPEVRQHYLKLVAEVLECYDVDGLELDWIRTPDNFDAKDAEGGRTILTDFVRDVRRQTQAAAQRRGHPVRLAVRVPARPEFARAKGFEAVAWAREGLLDMLIPSDWWSGCADTPVEDWRAQLGPDARQCLIVPSTGCTYACTPKGFAMSYNLAAMRGFTASMLDRGADGIHLFNHFHPVDTVVRLRTPAGKSVKDCLLAELLHAAGDRPGATNNARLHALTIHDCLPGKSEYRSALPAAIAPRNPLMRKIHIGPKPAAGQCVVRVGLEKSPDLGAAKLVARVNGRECRGLEDLPAPAKPDPRPEQPRMHVCEVAPRVMQFEAPLAALARGYNRIELSLEHGGPQTVSWLEIALEP